MKTTTKFNVKPNETNTNDYNKQYSFNISNISHSKNIYQTRS